MGLSVDITGDPPLRFLETLRRDRFSEVSLDRWPALRPETPVGRHLHVDDPGGRTAVAA
jgi:oxalate decarboxylase/phosphoglucose isomerase-like protein (cupin superfamily)